MSRWLNSISGKTPTFASTANLEKASLDSLTTQINRCILLLPASRLNVMIAIRAAAVPPLAVVKSDVASAVKLAAPLASDLACKESPIAVPTKPAMTQSRSAK